MDQHPIKAKRIGLCSELEGFRSGWNDLVDEAGKVEWILQKGTDLGSSAFSMFHAEGCPRGGFTFPGGRIRIRRMLLAHILLAGGFLTKGIKKIPSRGGLTGGPEGGFTERGNSDGFTNMDEGRIATIGSRVLCAEIAALVLLTLVMYSKG
ncbi:hypothetical protein [Pasteuria penetrans]|uniref:hypothetical protein n=1 Tax=Pasteuria penetrans TaxID=86005 RepID=UPI0011EBF97A|nr:hypothetical protein [Pasteuria penetrans]